MRMRSPTPGGIAMCTFGLVAATCGDGLPCPASGTVVAETKISAFSGGFQGPLDSGDRFGASVASLGDFDGDGITDIAAGAIYDDDGGLNRGAVWILLLNDDGTVKSEAKISSTAGAFSGALGNTNEFGSSVASLGDLDGDGVGDIAVGVHRDDDGGTDRGAVWILFLNADGTVKAEQKISSTAGGLQSLLSNSSRFGAALGALGDLDGDGLADLAVGCPEADTFGDPNSGAVWILFLNSDGTVKAEFKIFDPVGGAGSWLQDDDQFGSSIALMGGIDADGTLELAVGAPQDSDGGFHRGAVWILELSTDGSTEIKQKISDTEGGFQGELDNEARFGSSISAVGDLDGNGAADLAVGTLGIDDGGIATGGVYVLFLNPDGAVKGEQKISNWFGGLQGDLDPVDWFGSSSAAIGDLNGDGKADLAVGAVNDDEGLMTANGSVTILMLADGAIPFCQADIDPNGMIDSGDLNLVLAGFAQATPYGCPPDVNVDGIVDSDDLNAVLASFGTRCPK